MYLLFFAYLQKVNYEISFLSIRYEYLYKSFLCFYHNIQLCFRLRILVLRKLHRVRTSQKDSFYESSVEILFKVLHFKAVFIFYNPNYNIVINY